MKTILKIGKWILVILAGLLLLIFISLLVYRGYLKNSTKIKAPNGISSLEELSLGGIKQWIFIRGKDQTNPILLFLHGGPGEPMGGMPGSRKFDQGLINHFTVVHWDQRGSGKSYDKNISVAAMSHDSLVEDCNELIEHLLKRFKARKVFLVAHSGGTPIGLKTAYRYPEKIHAYVGVAQITNDSEQQHLSYNFIAEEAKRLEDIKAQKAIKSIGGPPFQAPEKIFKKAKYIVKYGGFIREKPYKHIINLMIGYLTSPEYSISEGVRTIRGKGLKFTMKARWEELQNIDFNSEITSVNVPIYFFQGKFDMIVPTVQVVNFYRGLHAKQGKKLIIFENSAHVPMLEEKKKYEEVLISTVLKESGITK